MEQVVTGYIAVSTLTRLVHGHIFRRQIIYNGEMSSRLYPGTLLRVLYHTRLIPRLSLLGSLTGHTHSGIPPHHDLVAGEELVDLLERQPLRLGVGKVDERDEAEVENAEVDVSLPANVVDRHGRDLDDEEGEDPVGGRGEGCGAGANGQGGIFGGH